MNARAQDDATPLTFAVQSNHVAACKELIAGGADVVRPGCCSLGSCLSPISWHPSLHTPQNVYNHKNRKTALMIAAQKGNLEVGHSWAILICLFGARQELFARPCMPVNPLCLSGVHPPSPSPQLTRMLLDAGADPCAYTKTKQTVSSLATGAEVIALVTGAAVVGEARKAAKEAAKEAAKAEKEGKKRGAGAEEEEGTGKRPRPAGEEEEGEKEEAVVAGPPERPAGPPEKPAGPPESLLGRPKSPVPSDTGMHL